MIVHSKNIILNGWERHVLGRDRLKSRAKTRKKCHFPQRRYVLSLKLLDFSQKIPIFKWLPNPQS